MATELYLKLGSGGDQVRGECRDRYHVGWIKLESAEWTPAIGKPLGTDLHLTKFADSTSPVLQAASSTGQSFGSAVFEMADPATRRPRLRFDLRDISIGDFYPGGAQGSSSKPREIFTLGFKTVQTNFNPVPDEDTLDKILKAFGLSK
jgi:type VI protein secretion system component Hcp